MNKNKNWWKWAVVGVGVVVGIRQTLGIYRLWKAGERVKEAQAEVDLLGKENQKLGERLKEVNTPEFVEREARDKLGYGKEGETLIILPRQNDANPKPQISNPNDEANWKKWWKLYVGE